ncbi:hypothetical protein Athai_05390 [Actinocatenispora thailandica]|uniref:DUF1232 domain-containing protein n=1 Tax=Actinocatenispora thailandica TaxID=227318 RepID=A0A7R7HV00_9ACTN|nr:hypothetical protein Athai_05390 [Actinocatenispora thailandica]
MAGSGAQRRYNGFRALGRALLARGGASLPRRIGALPRLFRARMRGEYDGLTAGRLAAMVVALVYVISPIDLVPEAFLLVFGLADDGVAVLWLAGALLDEGERFLSWERSRAESAARQPGPPPGAAGPQYGQPYPGGAAGPGAGGPGAGYPGGGYPGAQPGGPGHAGQQPPAGEEQTPTGGRYAAEARFGPAPGDGSRSGRSGVNAETR